jgi:transcriptional regulator with XRE-family HTH domain
LGQGWREVRTRRGLTLETVAESSGVDPARLKDLESGVAEAWFDEAILLARAYDLELDDLAAELLGTERRVRRG